MILRSNVVTPIIFLTICLCKASFAQTNIPSTPCPEIFQYTRKGNKNIGIITINHVRSGQTTVAVELSQHGYMELTNPGKLSLNFNKDKINEYLHSGRPFTYRVDFPLQNNIPGVTSIKVNGVQICSGPIYSSPRTIIKVEHTINAYLSGSSLPQEPVTSYNVGLPSNSYFSQGSALDSNIPQFLKFSRSFVDKMSSNPSSYTQPPYNQASYTQPPYHQPSYSYTPPSFDPPPFNHHQNSHQSFNTPSGNQFPSSSFNEPPLDSPTLNKPGNNPFFPSFSQPSSKTSSLNQLPFPSFNQPILNSLILSQPGNNPFIPSFPKPTSNTPAANLPSSSSFHQPTLDSAILPKPGNNPFLPAFPKSTSNIPAINQLPSSSLDQPTLDGPLLPQPGNNPFLTAFPLSTRNTSSLDDPTLDSPILPHPQINQQNVPFSGNPQNPFIKITAEIDIYRPVRVYGPTTDGPTLIAPDAIKPILIPPTTINHTPILPSDIDNRNPITEPASTDRATLEYINAVCGHENLDFDMKKLNVKGTVISKSRFPWIVAVFRRNNDDVDFRCGGSLISTRTVVSAAHCFYLGIEEMKPEDILISMGLHNLTERLSANNIDVAGLIIHPDYNPSQINLDADLAVVRLRASVTFTTSVRPICMWEGNKDVNEIVGRNGIIVGWGSDGRRNTTTVPTLVNATVVTEVTCIRSTGDGEFLALTSNRTICAGNLDGSGPCMGDSGNGLILRNRNQKWMLRGTVSATLGTPIQPCILDKYSIYSDIAMFIEWIGLNMLL